MNGWCLDYYEYLHSAYHTLFYVESAKQRYIRKGRCVLIACSDNYRSFSLALHGDSFPFEKDFIFSCVCCRWIYSYERRRLQGSGEGFGASRAVITGGCELPDLGADAWTWLGPPEDLQVLFTAEPALSPNSSDFLQVSDGESEAISCSCSSTAYRNPLIYSVFE